MQTHVGLQRYKVLTQSGKSVALESKCSCPIKIIKKSQKKSEIHHSQRLPVSPLVKGKTAWFYDLRHLRHPLASRDLHVTCSPLSSARALNQQDRNAHVLRSRCYRATINLNQLLRGHRSIVVNHPTYINFCDVTGTQFRLFQNQRQERSTSVFQQTAL